MKTKILLIAALFFAFSTQVFAQPVNDTFAGAIPITPSPEGTPCQGSDVFYLPFSTDGTTDSGQQGGCRSSGLDQFFTWTATSVALTFSSQGPGNPGIVVYDADTTNGIVEITCLDTFAQETISGWDIGDDLVIQIYDFEPTALSDVAFCLTISNNAPQPAPVSFTSQSSGASGSWRYGCVDMNGDGLDDLLSISVDNINIRQQESDGSFTTIDIGTTPADYSPTWSLLAADYNRDGFSDIVYGGGSGVTIMESDTSGGSLSYTEISGPEYVFSQRSNFVDINKDGNLDIFVCHDVEPNVYYINDGTNNFDFYQSGVTPGAPYSLGEFSSGGDYGSIWIDYDNDRDLDLFIAKCGGSTARRTNQMWTNDGTENYSENAASIGLADPMQTWSSAWGDFDNDGDMDVFVGASSGSHKLMLNDNGSFTDVTSGSGVDLLTLNSIETVTFDFDNDGYLDLVQGGSVLFGNGDMTFELYTNVFPGVGSYGDLNDDGYMDAFQGGSIYINNAETNNNWIKIRTVGTSSNANGIGARVEVHTPSGVQIRDVKSGDGFRYMNSMNTHVGIGSDTSVSRVVVYWPNSGCEEYLNPAINQSFTAVEGTGAPCNIEINPIVYMEGASINPNDGEETLMRDDLRVNGWLASNATTSPYADQLVANPSVFNVIGNDAIVDWVWVELRDADDNSVIIDSQSALLQRDGDVVDVDGVSPLQFRQDEGNYYVSVNHRNHLGIISGTSNFFTTRLATLDLSSDPSSVEGNLNAVVALANGKFGMYSGDFDGNQQIQNADASGVIQLIGGSGYEAADVDVNTQIQNTDVNALINPNIGRGQQFLRTTGFEEQLNGNILLTFNNAQITNDGSDDYYEADIFIESSGSLYLGSGQVYIDYNTAAFGENISSNGSLEYTQPSGSILGYSFGVFSDAYKDFIQNDNSTSRVSLSFQQNIAQVGLETVPGNLEVNSTPKLLFHIKIKYVDLNEDEDICFFNQGVFQDQFFTACGGSSTADCTNSPGSQITDDNYDCSGAAVDTLGIEEDELALGMVISPIPTKDILNITTSLSLDNAVYTIFDISGRIISKSKLSSGKIDISSLSSGHYILRIDSPDFTKTQKIIKQ